MYHRNFIQFTNNNTLHTLNGTCKSNIFRSQSCFTAQSFVISQECLGNLESSHHLIAQILNVVCTRPFKTWQITNISTTITTTNWQEKVLCHVLKIETQIVITRCLIQIWCLLHLRNNPLHVVINFIWGNVTDVNLENALFRCSHNTMDQHGVFHQTQLFPNTPSTFQH